MFAFGLILVWVWRRVRAGDSRPLAAATVIGILYLGIGVFGLAYRNGDPFMITVVMLGGLLLMSSYGIGLPGKAEFVGMAGVARLREDDPAARIETMHLAGSHLAAWVTADGHFPSAARLPPANRVGEEARYFGGLV